MVEQFKCPRCGFEQSPAEICRKCRINIQRYIDLQKSRNIIPGRGAQKRFEEGKQHPGIEPPSEEPQKPSPGPLPSKRAVPPKPPEIRSPEKERVETTRELSRIGELFSNSWDVYKRRIITLILLYLLSIVFLAAAFGVFFGTGYLLSAAFPDANQILIAAGSFVGIIAGSIAMVWGLAAFICAVSDETLGIKDALEQGSQKIWSFMWIFTLISFIITGGFFLFIIPGIIFSIWFFFSQFILAREEERGMNALLKSKEYVRGYWFDVFLRLFIVWLISAVIGMIPIIGPIVSFFYVPFMMIFIYLIYDDLKSVKGDVAYPSSNGEKLKWIGAGALGYILLLIIVIAFMGAYLTSSLFLLKGIIKSRDLGMMIPSSSGDKTSPSAFSELESVWTGAEINRGSGWTVTIYPVNQIDVKGPGTEWYKGRFTENHNTQPKQLDIEITDSPLGSYIGKTALGIYNFTGNTLILCGSEPGVAHRPSAFYPSGKVRCYELSKSSPAPQEAMPSSPEVTSPKIQEIIPSESGDTARDIMVYIYSLNYKGMVRLNGEELYEIKGEKDMNYNYSGGGKFSYGQNIIDVEYDSLPDPWKVELKIKVYKYDWDSKKEEVLSEWVINDKGGRKSFEVIVNR